MPLAAPLKVRFSAGSSFSHGDQASQLRKLSISANILAGGALMLYPRSSDPAHQTPLKLERAPEAQEGPEVIGVVVGRTESVRAGRGPLLDIPHE